MLWWAAFAVAGPMIPVQGSITLADGTAPGGTHAVAMRLYESASGGLPVHDESASVVLNQGAFTAVLGASPTLADTFFRDHPALWLEVAVDGGAPSARVAVGAAPFAAYATYAGDAATLGSTAAAAYLTEAELQVGAGLQRTGTTLSVAPGALADASVASNAAIAVSKLAPGANGQVLTTSGGVAGWAALPAWVTAFNGRTGAVSLTSADVTAALGFTPVDFGASALVSCGAGTVVRRKSDNSGWECGLPVAPDAVPWTRVSYDDFESGANGWSGAATSACGAAGNVLAGAEVGVAGVEVTKTISGLPAHKSIRITARVHAIDTWDWERVRLKVDGAEVWAKSVHFGHSTSNVCGHASYADRMNIPVVLEIAHTGSSLQLAFGSTLDESATESFAVDDVAVFVSNTEPGWRLVAAERFDSTPVGWSNNTLSQPSGTNSKILGGYNVYGAGFAYKVFDLGASINYSEVRVRSEFFVIDSWDYENAYLRVAQLPDATPLGASEGEALWTQPMRYCPRVNIVGGTWGDCDPYQIDRQWPASSRYLQVGFGTDLNEVATNESWGLKNVEIWVR